MTDSDKKIVPTAPGWWWIEYANRQEIVELVDRTGRLYAVFTDPDANDFIENLEVEWLRPVLSMEEEDRLRAIEGKLHVTKDAKRVMGGDTVYIKHGPMLIPLTVYRETAFNSVGITAMVSDCYSTEKAAREAAKGGV